MKKVKKIVTKEEILNQLKIDLISTFFHFTNQLREEGKHLDIAIREAGEIRFLPIILTSLTAIGGLIPIALSTNPLISPLAIVLIGGLISSTLLSRIFTPVIYKLIPPKMES